ncbi:MAG: winged helix-turn-helix transcriptional regulator [Ferrovum sp.]|nr:winged helix-turn-helix transcriptional regulator [Ferrovum sp.]
MIFPEHSQTQIISAFRALGEPNRLRILCSLGLECRPVTDIINSTGLGQTNVSFHLRVLREAGFVRAERRGAFIYYCLADTELLHILHDLKHWFEGLQPPGSGAVERRNRPV